MRKSSSVIKETEDGLRLDNWLSERFKYHSRQRWQEEIKNGLVTVNEKSVKPSAILREGDYIDYKPPRRPEPPVNLSYEVVYEDEDLLVVNKPGDLPCHPSGCFFKNTLWALLKEKYEKFHFINRLDRETSGLMIIALNKKAAATLAKQITERTVIKEYQLVVHGVLEQTINAVGWLGPDTESQIHKKRAFFLQNVIDNPGDKEGWESASTWLYPDRNNGELTLVNVRLGTGRFHQIRATAYSMGYPVVGDKIYGVDDHLYLRFINKELSPQDRRTLILDRQALHASSLTFKHPVSNEDVTFSVPMRDAMLRKLNLL